jgi:iron-sulfur cluster repair protein YtfE (RIC family)
VANELASALTREHREIDAGIVAFVEALDAGGDPGDAGPALQDALTALRRHIYLEEEFLFPAIQGAAMVMPVQVMLREHGQLWRSMDELGGLLDGAGPATGSADPQWRAALKARCQAMLAILDGHNRKEEPIIYPHLDSDLAPDARTRLAAFVDTGRLPDGWVCQLAAS